MADPNYRGVAGPHCSGGIAGVSADAGGHHEIRRFTADRIAACKAWRTRSGITSTRTAQRLANQSGRATASAYELIVTTRHDPARMLHKELVIESANAAFGQAFRPNLEEAVAGG